MPRRQRTSIAKQKSAWHLFTALAIFLVLPSAQAFSGRSYSVRDQKIQLSWMGGQFVYSGFSLTSAESTSGDLDGKYNEPTDVVGDNNGILYIADLGNHRIVKIDSSGNFLGWIGRIKEKPTGGAAGCTSALVGAVTPGWCTGGKSQSGTGDKMFNRPNGIALDSSGNLYVADESNHRIQKILVSTGAYVGWIGRIHTSPTGGAGGCNGAAVNSFTPGWCTGGRAKSGSGDGMLIDPLDVAVDSAGYLYVIDQHNYRIARYNSNGTAAGWTGLVGTQPTGGDPGCTTAATLTPGWCTGGTASSSDEFAGMARIVVDSSGNFYFSNSYGSIVKYTTAGTQVGWTGMVGSTPTGGAPGCTSAGYGSSTPGWCTGGYPTSTYNGTDNNLNYPSGIALDAANNLYLVANAIDRFRINKYSSTGAYIGWTGGIEMTPTGGAAGCIGATGYTSGWCTGGLALGGSLAGQFGDAPGSYSIYTMGLAYDSYGGGRLYLTDSFNHRISKYNVDGSYVGNNSADSVWVKWSLVNIPSAETNHNGFYQPEAVAFDSQGNLYVTEPDRFLKFDKNGNLIGWFGVIKESPTGGSAGCAGAAVGTLTPGWCTGGRQGDVGVYPDGEPCYMGQMAFDSSDNFYIISQQCMMGTISKYTSAGAYVGWSGRIDVSPTGGDPGCAGAASGTLTPGWCTGGLGVTAGVEEGIIVGLGIVIDQSTNFIYMADSDNSRIIKYRTNGTYVGWIGKIGVSPTGGDAGCNGASVGAFTPGWCTGGESTSGTGNGALSAPSGLSLDSAGNLYVADKNNHRISKYTASTGAFGGWIGRIQTSPTGGDAGCNGAGVGTFTPGWCTGGRANSGTGDGMMQNPNSIHVTSRNEIYVSMPNRVSKYTIAGKFVGWMGNVATSPTGGAPGCAGLAVSSFTPGFCKGGTAAANSQLGGFTSPTCMASDKSGAIYVPDNVTSRLSRFTTH